MLNFGVHGYGIDQATLRLRDEALAYAPDLVILGFIADDVERDVLSFRDFAKPRFALAGGALQLGNVPVPTPEQVLARPQGLPLSYLAELTRFAAGDLLDRTRLHPYEARESWRVTAELLGEAERETRAAGARFVLAYFPTQLDTLPAPEERLAAAWARENGVDFVDLRGAFAALPEAEWRRLYRGVHWSPAGNQLVARLLHDAIEERRLLAPATHAALP